MIIQSFRNTIYRDKSATLSDYVHRYEAGNGFLPAKINGKERFSGGSRTILPEDDHRFAKKIEIKINR